jgi:hypothetical protein
MARRTDAGAMLFVFALEEGDVVVKLARAAQGQESIDREVCVLRSLWTEPGLSSLRRIIPKLHGEGWLAGHRYLVTSALPGKPASALLGGPGTDERLLSEAVGAIRELHVATGSIRRIYAEDVERWSDRPLTRLARALSIERSSPAIVHIEAQLADGLCGRDARVSWVHGDYWCGNVLVSDRGWPVVGIVDWDMAEPEFFADSDIVHLVLTTRAHTSRCELGDIVSNHLRGDPLPAVKSHMLAAAGVDRDASHERSVLLLTWIRHVSGNLGQPADYLRRKVWTRRNVRQVLRELDLKGLPR